MTDNFDASQTAPACQQGDLATEAARAITALRAERDELRAAIFGHGDYCKTLRNGNFVGMALSTEAGRKGAIARAEAAEAKLADWQASQTYRYIGRDGKPVLARDLEDRAEAAEARVAELSKTNAVWQINCRETLDAMYAMRDSINEHIQMPSLESDLLQGSETSVFCATVAEAVIAHVSAAEARALAAEAAALERAAQVAERTEIYQNHVTVSRIRALITPAASTALDAALADARKAGKLEGLREAKATAEALPRRKEPLGGQTTSYVQLETVAQAIDDLAARVEGGDA